MVSYINQLAILHKLLTLRKHLHFGMIEALVILDRIFGVGLIAFDFGVDAFEKEKVMKGGIFLIQSFDCGEIYLGIVTHGLTQIQQRMLTMIIIMIQFKTTEKKKINFGSDSSVNITAFQMQADPRYHRQQNYENNINSQLTNNMNQIKELLKERKKLLEKKAQTLIHENRAKLKNISDARPEDLRNQAKMLGDRSTEQLVEDAESFNGPKPLIRKISEISNMSSFQGVQKDQGKRFWQSNRQFEREIKKKNQVYVNQSRQLQTVNQKVRSIFVDIERLESEMIGLLTKDRKDPDHIKKAEKFNEEIEKKKITLKDAKIQKQKIKSVIEKTIDSILDFNHSNESIFKKRAIDLEEMFGGKENMNEFDGFVHNLEIVIESKAQQSRNSENNFINLKKLINQYDILLEQVEKYKTEENQIFNTISEDFKQKIKLAVLEKAYLSGVSNPRDQFELLKKCRAYRKLLSDLDTQRPIINESLQKMSQMTKMLYPVKKAYESEESRKQKLKQVLNIMMAEYSKIQRKYKKQRDFKFDMESLRKKREVIEAQLDECAERANFNEYKNKVKQLQKIDKQIEIQRDSVNQIEMQREEEQLLFEAEQLNDNYSDIIEQIIVNEKKLHISTYLNKLSKRLSFL